MARSRKRTAKPPKTLSVRARRGQRGVNAVERIVLEMGSLWTPTGGLEVGIDGYIELFDPASHHALGTTIATQSKALSTFAGETEKGFDYWCDQRDLDYWMAGNWPVVLVISRAGTDEAYWISVQNYFATPERRASTRVTFDKVKNRFTKDSFRDLAALAVPRAGLYLAPTVKVETLHSNLLPIESLPTHLSIADTDCRSAKDVWESLRNEGGDVDGAWVLKGKRMYSFHDLGTSPWNRVCDAGTHERFATGDWAYSADLDRRRLFVNLMNLTLRSQVNEFARYWPAQDCYAVRGTPRKVAYRSLKRDSKVSAVSAYSWKREDGRVFKWWRHLAFRPRFVLIGGTWHLEVTPTYLFTQEGQDVDRFHESRLKGIKRMEGNRAVLSSVLFWADRLRPSRSLFDKSAPLVRFGPLVTFSLPVGIDDRNWLSRDPEMNEIEKAEPGETLFDSQDAEIE